MSNTNLKRVLNDVESVDKKNVENNFNFKQEANMQTPDEYCTNLEIEPDYEDFPETGYEPDYSEYYDDEPIFDEHIPIEKNTYKMVKIDDIIIDYSSRRSVNMDILAEIVKSVEATTLLNPITVNKNNHLIAGLHRIEALRQLGYTHIPAYTVECKEDSDLFNLIKTSENFARVDLSTAELAEAIYEGWLAHKTLYPERYKTLNQFSSRGENIMLTKTHAQEMIKKLGCGKSKYYELLGTAQRITPEAKVALKRIGAFDNTEAYKNMSQLSPMQQVEFVKRNLAKQDFVKELEFMLKPPDAKRMESIQKAKDSKIVKQIEATNEVEDSIEELSKRGLILSVNKKLNNYVVMVGEMVIRDTKSLPEIIVFLNGCLEAVKILSIGKEVRKVS